MSFHEVMVEGTLQADGTLQLDRKPDLSPGRVTVVLRQEDSSVPLPREDWFQFLLSARKKMEEAGCRFLDEKELQTHIEWLREGDNIDEMLQQERTKLTKPEGP